MSLSINKELIDKMVRLQEIEIECEAIEKTLRELPQQIKALDLKLELFQKTIDAENDRTQELEKMYRTYESEMQEYQSKVKKSHAKLNEVKTNKEYKSSLKEIEELEKHKSKVEDDMLECLELVDDVKKQIMHKQEEYRQLEKQVGTEKEILQDESSAAKQKLSDTMAIRNKVAQHIPAELMQKYSVLKKSRSGIALAGVKNAVCQGCHVNIPPQLFNELHRFDRLQSCPHCERIVYPIIEEDSQE